MEISQHGGVGGQHRPTADTWARAQVHAEAPQRSADEAQCEA